MLVQIAMDQFQTQFGHRMDSSLGHSGVDFCDETIQSQRPLQNPPLQVSCYLVEWRLVKKPPHRHTALQPLLTHHGPPIAQFMFVL